MKTFKNIFDFQAHFNTEEKCREYLETQRWGNTPACPCCGSTNVKRFATNNRIFKCREKECRSKFSVTVGTVYENSKLPLTKWFLATYILTVHSKGISSLQLATWLGITQKSAWHLTHRIREMLNVNSPELLEGIVEIDETYVGGSESNKHTSKRTVRGGAGGKAMVLGAVQRGGEVRARVIAKTDQQNVIPVIKEVVADGTIMVTDEHHAYNKLHLDFTHKKVNHREKEYVRYEDIKVHTNSIEGFWNILKKQLDGIHHSVSQKHLQRYVNESSFRYNNRKSFQDEKFDKVVANCEGSLKWKPLTSK
jgi:transposase-like protein